MRTRPSTPSPHPPEQALVKAAPDSSAVMDQGQKLFLAALNQSIGCLELDLDGTILSVNEAYLHMSGYSREELLGCNHRILCTSEFLLSENYQDYWTGLVKRAHTAGLFRCQRKDGLEFWAEGAYHTIQANSGAPLRVIKVCLDVTGYLKTAAKQTAQLEAIGRHFLVALYSPDGKILSVNDNFNTLLGYDSATLYKQKLVDTPVLGAQNREAFQETWNSASSGQPQSCLMCWTAEDGSQVWLDSVFSPIYCAKGKLRKIIQIASDATLRLKHEQRNTGRLQQLARAVAHAGQALVISGGMNRILYVNPTFTRMLGYTAAESRGRFTSFMLGPGEQAHMALLRERILAKEAFYSEEIAYCKDGKRLWLSMATSPIFNEDGSRSGTVSVLADITEGKLYELLTTKALEGMACDLPTEHLLALSCSEIERVIPGLSVNIFGVGKHGGENRLEAITVSHRKLRAFSQKICNGRGLDYPSMQAANTGLAVMEKDMAQSGCAPLVKEAFREAGLNACYANPIKSANGRILGVVTFYQTAFCEDLEGLKRLAGLMTRLCGIILEREENRIHMRRMSFYDPVTGLPNRDLLIASAEQLVASRAMNETGLSMAVLYVSVDRFAHLCQASELADGEAILRRVAGCLTELAGPGDIVGHVFAEEFAVIAPGCNTKQAFEKAKRIQNYVTQAWTVNGMEMNINLSIGISMYPENGHNIETLLTRASTTLFQQKKKGQAALVFFSTGPGQMARKMLSLETRLRRAIDNGKLHLCYQPQLAVGTGALRGVEALSRWDDDKQGSVSPVQFIPLAEEAGLIENLSDWVLREACRQMSEWRKRCVAVPTVAVNLSTTNFQNPKLLGNILGYLKEYGLTPHDLILELTESVLMDPEPNTMNNIRGASSAGIALALDDFGTGYSSLSYLKDLPFSEIKLDRAFINDLTSAEASRHLSLAAILIGRGLNLQVTAEGVETIEQYRILKRHQCNSVQGFLFSKPIRAYELENWLLAWRPHSMEDQYRLM